MSVACTLTLTQERASHLWMFGKPLPTKVKTASVALGEIPSVPEEGPTNCNGHVPSGRCEEIDNSKGLFLNL
jgi:hypothetical protein